jgi:hypothetical protein
MPIQTQTKRPIEEIVKTIENHPALSYDELKAQAKQIGISIEDFDQAWQLAQQKPQKLPIQFRFPFYYGCALLVCALAGIAFTIWFPKYGPVDAGMQCLIQYASYFFLGILTTHFASRFAGGRGNLFTTTKLLVLLGGIGYLVSLVAATGGLALAFAGFMGAISLLIVLFAVSKAYGLGIIQLFVFLVLDGVFSFAAYAAIFGIKALLA